MTNQTRRHPLFNTSASRATVLSTDQVVAPNDEFFLNDMLRAPELYLRPMQTSKDMSIKPARGK